MKKLVIILTVFSAILFFAEVVNAEQIDYFQVDIELKEDSSFVVTESIFYNFENTEHHGIYRDIPYSYTRSGSKYNVRINVLSVTDEDGNTWPYTVSKFGGDVSIKIGDPDSYVSGEQIYRITYEVKRAINYFDEHDELYWNVTGTEWEVPVEQASVTLRLPSAVEESDIQLACYTGTFGSKQQDCDYKMSDSQNISFDADLLLSSYEGLSILVGLPKGVVVKPGTWQQIQWFLADNWPVFIPLAVLIVMFYLWYTRGRDPKVRSTIIPMYEAPKKMPAGELGIVIDERVDLKDISGTIIQLAVNGYIKIKEIEKKKLFGKGRDYELIQLKEPDNKLKDYEKRIMKGIFDTGKSKTVSSMKNHFYVHLKKIKKSMYDLVVSDDYFPTNPEKVRQMYMIIASFILPLGFFLLVGFENVIAGVSTIIAGIIAMVFSRAMPRKTKHGTEVHKQILGFKWFLSITETERLKFHNAPDKSPKEFEKFLPYAMVLGVEKEWAEQFKDIYVTPPEWYEGRPGTAFGALYMVGVLNSMSTNFNSVAASRPGGGGGAGSSGFGGGGFSGGGFGGGGGGSW